MKRFSTMGVLLTVALTGCPGDSQDSDTDLDTGTGTEADTEADTETDTEIDTEADTEGITFTADLVYVQQVETQAYVDEEVDGDPAISERCESDFAVTGEEFVGFCNDCDWAFELTSTRSGGDCVEENPLVVLAPDEDGEKPSVFFWSIYNGPYASYTDMLMTGWSRTYTYTYEDGSEYVDQYMSGLAITYGYYGNNYGLGTMTQSGTSLDWTLAGVLDSEAEYPYGSTECTGLGTAADLATAGATTGTGELPCGTGVLDVWEFTAEAGTVVDITVDTRAEETAFDPGFSLYDPAGCYVDIADDSFDCAFEPTNWRCPGMSFTVATTGTHTVSVRNFGSCTSTEEAPIGSYAISISGADSASLLADNVTNSPTLVSSTTVNAAVSGILSAPL